jgi:hypothetical protein
MALVLGSANGLTLVGAALVQAIPFVATAFFAVLLPVPEGRRLLRRHVSGRPMLLPVATVGILLVLLSVSWVSIALAALYASFMLLLNMIGRLLIWIELSAYPRFLDRAGSLIIKWRALSFARRWWNKAAVKYVNRTKGYAKPKEPDAVQKLLSSPRSLLTYAAIAALVPLLNLSVQMPLEEVSYGDKSSVLGYVVESDEAWTTVVTSERDIRIERTEDVASRAACPDINASLLEIPNHLDEIKAGLQRILEPSDVVCID